jgi:predicted transcriptional regulator
MDNKENNINQKVLEFPIEVQNLTKVECAKILRKALSAFEKFKTQSEIAKVTGINEKTIGDYFTARHKPPQEKWDLIREVLFEEIKKVIPEKKLKDLRITEAKHSAERLKAIAFLLKDELEYFKESSPEVREILKEYLPGPTIGYIASLLTALYDENQLEIFKNFTKK